MTEKDLTARLDAFAGRSKVGGWTAESRYLSYEMDLAIIRHERRFRLVSAVRDSQVLVYELEWLGSGQWIVDIYRDFLRMYAEMAEISQFVQLDEGIDAIVVSIVSGSDTHGHLAKVTIGGERVARVLRETREAAQTWRRAPSPG